MPDIKSSESPEKQKKEVPLAVIRRLPVYQRYLAELYKKEIERVSSQELAAKACVTASQLRQDLNWFGNFGQQGYGYRVGELLMEINKILGLDNNMHMALVGAGNLGRALICYPNFKEKGFLIKAAFDTSPELIGVTIGELRIQSVIELESYLKNNTVQIGIIATPVNAAQDLANIFIQYGVGGIWNFAPVTLKAPSNVIVEHVHISESLLMLSFRMRQSRIESVKFEL